MPDSQTSLSAARTRFLSSAAPPEARVPAPILDSWGRSARAGVDPCGSGTPWAGVDRSHPLARAAREPIRRLIGSLGALDIGVVLSDERARVIWRHDTGRSATRLLDSIDLAPGFDYSEHSIGTNGVGSAVLTGRPIYVSGSAHFQERFAGYACAGSPIRHPLTGRLEGVLDLTSDAAHASPLLLSLAEQTANEIRHRMLEHATELEHAALDAFATTGDRGDGVAVVVRAGQLELRNTAASQRLDAALLDELVDAAEDHLSGGESAAFERFIPDPDEPGREVPLRIRASLIRAQRSTGVLLAVDFGAPAFPRQGAPGPSRPSVGPPAYRVVDGLAFGKNLRSGSWQLARRDLQASLRRDETVLLLGETGTGKISLLGEAAARVRPEDELVVLAAEEQRAEIPLLRAVEEACARAHRPGTGLILALRNIHRFPENLIAQAARLLRLRRAGSRHATLVLTADSLDAEPRRLDALLPYISHSVALPPLRERRADFDTILTAVLEALEAGSSRRLTDAARRSLADGHWPGNMSQLTDALRAALARTPEGPITVASLPEHAFHALRPLTRLEQEERNAFISALYLHRGNRTAAARYLGVSRATFYRRLAAYGLDSV